jgi:hypothetical protein
MRKRIRRSNRKKKGRRRIWTMNMIERNKKNAEIKKARGV